MSVWIRPPPSGAGGWGISKMWAGGGDAFHVANAQKDHLWFVQVYKNEKVYANSLTSIRNRYIIWVD